MASRIKFTTVTADGAVKAAAGTYYGMRVVGDGTNAARAIAYDNASAASGTVVDEIRAAAAGAEGSQLPIGVPFYNGLYIDVTTVGRVVVWYT